MKKEVIGNGVFFVIEWSEYYKYERISSGRILPDMPGIIHFADQSRPVQENLMIFAAWREGLRSGMKNIFDPLFTPFPSMVEDFSSRDLMFRYCVIDSSPEDMKDVMFWLLQSYNPKYNDTKRFDDTKRYRDISIREVAIGDEKKVQGFKR